MIRILHVLGGMNIGGAESMVMNLYRTIDRSKIQFDFIIHSNEKQAYEDEIVALGGKIYRFPQFKGRNFVQITRKWSAFFNNHPEYKILHSHVRSYASLYLPIAKRYGVKTIVHSHSTSNGKGMKAIAKAVLQFPLRYQADYLMACSIESGEWLFGRRALQKENYVFIPNAINLSKYKKDQIVREKYRAELALGDNLVLGHVGRMMAAKNHTFLLDVFNEVHKIKKDTILVLVGDGDLRSEIEALIAAYELDESVRLLGNRNDVPNLMQAMDIFVFPSRWEGLPISVIEAQAAGLPCIISNRISEDVDITKLIHRLSIDTKQPWIDKIIGMKCERLDVAEDIRKAGFDIVNAAKNLETFYCELWSDK